MPFILTPPFPEYPSGHSVQSSAASKVLASVLGEPYPFSDKTRERDGAIPRKFTGFVAAAKEAGMKHDWRPEGKLYFKNQIIDRHGPDYQALLDRAYAALAAQNEIYRDALKETGTRPLIHTIGKDDPKETVLTERELCDRLMKLRDALNR